MVSQFFNVIFYQPLYNLLVFFYNVLPGHDIGLAIIVLTLLIKVVLFPLNRKGLEAQRKLQEMQPRLKEIQEKHKHDKVQQTQETMKLYQDYGVHPLGGCLPLLVQLPVLIALFRLFRAGFVQSAFPALYSFIANPGNINPFFLGLVDLSKQNVVLAVLAGIAQFAHSYLISRQQLPANSSNDFSAVMQRQMIFMGPIFTFLIALPSPSAVGLYWLVNTLFSIGEHYLVIARSPRRSV